MLVGKQLGLSVEIPVQKGNSFCTKENSFSLDTFEKVLKCLELQIYSENGRFSLLDTFEKVLECKSFQYCF